MDKEFDLTALSQKVTEDFKAADQARAYVAITTEHGPSQQLIDFINFDGKLGEEIGLEGWSNFSTLTQHEVLLSKLNPDAMEAVAMEGFRDFLKKYKVWLTGAGAVGAYVLGGPLWIGLLAAGVAGLVLARADTIATTLRDFNGHKAAVNTYVSSMKTVIGSLPSDGNSGKWVGIKDKVETVSSKLHDDFFKDTVDNYKKIADGGWTPSELISAAKWYNSTVEEIEELQKKFSADLEKVNADGIEDAKAINAAISEVYNSFKEVHGILKYLKSDLDKVAKAYDRKVDKQ